MATYNATSLSGGSAPGGLFNLSDADLIALTTALEQPGAVSVDRILAQQGATTGATDETWGIVEV